MATGASYTLNQVTQTQYDFSPTPNPNYPQTHLRGRVSTIANANQTTYYSYDVLGNVHTFYQNIVGFKSFRTDYEYDLISGKVNQVVYQAGQVDAQYHKYRYDADLRLRTAYQGTHPHLWTRIARYFYYAHGALARTEIGEQVAGNDFRYSLQGWIMGVNGLEVDTTEPKLDPSKDGFTNAPNPNRWQARDEFAYALGYHDSAYIGIGNPDLGLVADAWNPASGLAGLGDDILGIGDRKGLNNGNIAFMLVNVPQFERQEQYTSIAGFAYQYDQLHRIRQSIDYRVKDGKNWDKTEFAKTAYTYDPNGNILTLQRTAPNAGAGSGSTDIDDLGYFYNANTNQLRAVDDREGAPHAGFGDIGNTTKYYYNAIGQLVRDDATIASIDWNIQGKVDLVKFSNGNPNVAYTYDPFGNRLTKKVADTTTYYIRDAQGNSFATYKKIRDNINNRDTTRLIEQYLYASSRLGVRSAGIIVKIRSTNALLPDSARCFSTAMGVVSFEQTNHLGDVVVTLSDKVLGADVDADNAIDYYKSIVKSASLTYPFGWDIPNRKFTAGEDYRFGFNGKENDKEWNVQDYGFRLYDTRIARFISEDPITAQYPELTPYQFAGNSPIANIDLDGLEPHSVHSNDDNDGTGSVPGSNNNSNSSSWNYLSSASSMLKSAHKDMYKPTNLAVRKVNSESAKDFKPYKNGIRSTALHNGIQGTTTAAEHALEISGKLANSDYISVSYLKGGAKNIKGRPYIINMDKVIATGSEVINHPQLKATVQMYALQNNYNPAWGWIEKNTAAESEGLVKTRILAEAFETENSINLKAMHQYGKYLGYGFTVLDIGIAGFESYNTSSMRPLISEGIRQTGSWAGGVAGMAAAMSYTSGLNLLPGIGTALNIGAGVAGGITGYIFGNYLIDKFYPTK